MNLLDNRGMRLALLTFMMFFLSLLQAVPFVPEYQGDLEPEKVYPSERFDLNRRGSDLPENILVLMVEFEDIKFITTPEYPDFMAHDTVYFAKYLEHLCEYYRDNSHGNYNLTLDNFDIHETVFTAPNTMGFYGENNSGKSALLISDLVSQADSEIDFSLYDGFIVFHAGAGQEADLTGNNSDEIISTFLSRKSFQAYFEPENDDFPGLIADEAVLTDFVLCPETLWQPDNLEPDINGENGSPIYSFFGVLAHHYGHLIGLPTLFDNVSSNGKSRGIGGFGIMGQGPWNAAGYVPAPPCAWSRYYLGWEDVVVVDSTSVELDITFPNASSDKGKMYRIDISDSEYFLIENSQQNPDGSYFVNSDGDTLATYTFPLSDNQEYYDSDHPYAGQPRFDFFQNSYEGSEWRFYLPGYAYGDRLDMDGSGLLIWHIDELIISENFTSDFNENTINGDARHKGVDLEEADGVQNLDTIFTTVYGSGDDSFREGNNNYFGKQVYQGLYSEPTAVSYYGGNRLEIKNISQSDTVMTFDVAFEWSLSGNYSGSNENAAAIIDFDNDGENELFYALPDGNLYVWKDDQVLVHIPQSVSLYEITGTYAWDEQTGFFAIPAKLGDIAGMLTVFSIDGAYNLYTTEDYFWASNPVFNLDQTNSNHMMIAANHRDGTSSMLKIWDENLQEITEIIFEKTVVSNLMLFENQVAFVDAEQYIHLIDLSDYSEQLIYLNTDNLGDISSILWADFDGDDNYDYLITTEDSKLLAFEASGELFSGFPVNIPLHGLSVPSLADLDGNGLLDLLYGGENQFCYIDYTAKITKPELEITFSDSMNLAGGAIAVNLDSDIDLEIVSNISRNRLCIWDRISDNNYRLYPGFPLTFQTFSQSYPVIGDYASYGKSFYYSSNDGAIYKQEVPNMDEFYGNWTVKYGNLARSAAWVEADPVNVYEDDNTLIKEKLYFHPNPLNTIFTGSVSNGFYYQDHISLNLMTSKDAEVKISVYDIAGNKILSGETDCEAYVQKGFLINCRKLSSGVYFAIIKCDGEQINKKFAIEK